MISYTRAHHDDARRWRRTEAAEGPEAAAAKKASVDLGLFFCRRSPPPPPLPRRVWLSLGGASDRSRCCTTWHSCGSQGLCVIGEACWQQVRIERRNEEGEHWLPCSSRQTIEREFFVCFFPRFVTSLGLFSFRLFAPLRLLRCVLCYLEKPGLIQHPRRGILFVRKTMEREGKKSDRSDVPSLNLGPLGSLLPPSLKKKQASFSLLRPPPRLPARRHPHRGRAHHGSATVGL